MSFKELDLIRDGKKVTWEYLGEGWSGDYNPDDPEDTQLLRFSCSQIVDIDTDDGDDLTEGWQELPDSSYCTRMPINTPYSILAEAAARIMQEIEDVNYKKALEQLSYLCPEDFGYEFPEESP